MKGLLTLFSLFSAIPLFAQVGINTDSPRAGSALDVNGSMKSANALLPANLPPITLQEKETFVYLVQDQSTDAIELLDLSASGTGGISSILTYQLTDVNGDWVLDFDTKISSTNYALVILSAWFNEDLEGDNPAPPVARAKQIGGTWHLEADYSAVSSDNNGTWNVTCVVYPKTYAKIFPLQVVNMGNTSTAAAVTPIVSY